MTKKEELVWRLKDKPTVSEVTELMTQNIITKEEAREILFNTKSAESIDIDALRKQIEFLEGLVKELSKNQHITTIPVYVDRYIERWRPTYSPVWMSTGTLTGGVGINAAQNTSIANYTNKLIN